MQSEQCKLNVILAEKYCLTKRICKQKLFVRCFLCYRLCEIRPWYGEKKQKCVQKMAAEECTCKAIITLV